MSFKQVLLLCTKEKTTVKKNNKLRAFTKLVPLGTNRLETIGIGLQIHKKNKEYVNINLPETIAKLDDIIEIEL